MRYPLMAFLLLFIGCASVEKKNEVPVADGILLKLPPPSEITPPVKAVQLLTVSRDGRKRTFEAILENRNNKMTLAIVTPLWPTPMQAVYDGKSIEVDRILRSKIPFDISYILADIILVFAPSEVLKKWLSENANLKETKKQRTIGDSIVITYDNADPWLGKINLKHKARNYEIAIENLKVEKL